MRPVLGDSKCLTLVRIDHVWTWDPFNDQISRMPQTEPLAPPTKPRETPVPQRKAPPQPRRELDPFNPDWPKTRPTPEPKAEESR